MKKTIFTTAFAITVLLASAQLKVITGGLVGINNTAPQHKLDINAGTYPGLRCIVSHTADYGYGILSNVNRANTKALAVQLNGTDEFVVYGNGNGWCQGSWIFSDKTLKENIDTLKGALGKVLKLQGYTYNFKPSVSGEQNPKTQIGLIAQDVETVVPEVVATNEKGIKGVAYQNMIALLIEAIKEQDKKITQLRSDLDSCCKKKTSMRMMNQGSDEQGNSINIHELELANNTVLFQNFPNPFADGTTIKYFIPDNINSAQIIFLDEFGNKLKEFKVEEKGMGQLNISSANLSSGIYSYSIIVNGKIIDTKKMIRNK